MAIWGEKLSVSINIQRGWKDYQGVIHNTYHGGNIGTENHVVFSIPEDVARQFLFPNFATPMPGTLRGVIYNDIAPIDKISLNGLGMTKDKAGVLSIILKIGMEVAQYYTVLNYGPPSP